MSNTTHTTLWQEAQNALADLVSYDLKHFPPDAEAEETTATIITALSCLYLKYIQIFRKLEYCYDQIVHPQKRILVKRVLDLTMGRVLEIKNELVNLTLTEFNFFDDLLSDMKLSPNDLEMPIPKYFLSERTDELKERENTLDAIIATIETSQEEEPEMTLTDAVRLIQIHERARQGRLHAKIMKALKLLDMTRKQRKGKSTLTQQEAAIVIQKVWKGYLTRKMVKRQREQEMVFLEMMRPTESHRLGEQEDPLAVDEKGAEHKRNLQKVHQDQYNEALVRIKKKLIDREANEMQESMQDKIRTWMYDFIAVYDKVPDYPKEEDGGSVLILEDNLTLEDVERLEKERKDREKEKKKDTGSPKDKKVKKEGEEKEEYEMQPSVFASDLEICCEEYDGKWKDRDELDNPAQRHDEKMIITEKRLELREEIRATVDVQMQAELDRMRDAHSKDKGKKPSKKPGGKKGGKGGKKGKKKEKDLTADRTLESLYEELVVNGIIRKYPKVSIREFVGDYSYLGSYLTENEEPATPSLADVRRVITEHGILPLGSQMMRENAPLIKSILLVGPKGSGKTKLVDIICSETGSVMFDLSATNLVGKYPGKDGLKMLLHLIKKVGFLMQPSVVFIKDADKTFLKKVPKQDKILDPKRLKGALPKFLKTIAREERIVLIGTTSEPFGADMKGLTKLYQKIIMIPKPSYTCRTLLWKHFIERLLEEEAPQLNYSTLAKISDGYTAGSILEACQYVLTDFRTASRYSKIIETMEFIPALAKTLPVYNEEESALEAWYYKTPLGRAYYLEHEAEGNNG